jgi:hypothetical protein
VALVILALVLAAQYGFGFAGIWRPVYAVGMVASLWLLLFVLVAQAFNKIGFLNALAPTGTEPPFAIAQLVLLVVVIWAGYRSVRGFHPSAPA